MKIRCSRCCKELSTIAVRLESSVVPLKIINGCQMVPVENTEEPTCEILCPECFSLYADCLNQLNMAYNGQYRVNMVEMVDDVQYGDEGL